MKFFSYSDNTGFVLFNTLEEAIADTESNILDCYDCEWQEGLESCCYGELKGIVKETNVRFRPQNEALDHLNVDSNGDYWGENIDQICDYGIVKIEDLNDV